MYIVTAFNVLKGEVSGVAEMDGIVYIICQGSQSIQSYCSNYESLNWRKNKPIVVGGLQDASDMVACVKTRRLYIADQGKLLVVSPTSHVMVSHASHLVRSVNCRQPANVRSSVFLSTFHQWLKTHRFEKSLPEHYHRLPVGGIPNLLYKPMR